MSMSILGFCLPAEREAEASWTHVRSFAIAISTCAGYHARQGPNDHKSVLYRPKPTPPQAPPCGAAPFPPVGAAPVTFGACAGASCTSRPIAQNVSSRVRAAQTLTHETQKEPMKRAPRSKKQVELTRTQHATDQRKERHQWGAGCIARASAQH